MKLEEIIKEHGVKKLSFSNYYKYSFSYAGDGINLAFGGDSDQIYKFNLEKEMTLEDLLKKTPIDEYSILEINNNEVEIE